jgi:ATP-binding cassette subfamily G (WHITE) protein 2 (PDR)
VSGATWLYLSYGYTSDHIWRNFGIIIAFFIFFMATFLVAVEYKSPPQSRGEVLVFQMGKEPKHLTGESTPAATTDEEHGPTETARVDGAAASRLKTNGSVEAMKKELHAPQDIFTWRNVCCDVLIKGEPRRLLSDVTGYVKPGTLTALMGESGAGKTTLLDTYVLDNGVNSSLAQRNETGIISGDMFVNGKPLPPLFQRSCGYVQQQDV